MAFNGIDIGARVIVTKFYTDQNIMSHDGNLVLRAFKLKLALYCRNIESSIFCLQRFVFVSFFFSLHQCSEFSIFMAAYISAKYKWYETWRCIYLFVCLFVYIRFLQKCLKYINLFGKIPRSSSKWICERHLSLYLNI